ncbi:MAG: hypothetical protein H0U67_04945 [Gemmatimonadetes bacterium]|nr:hypothetical protein [Gemmatimonadota bacterium]
MNPSHVRLAGRVCSAVLLFLVAGCGANWNPPAIGNDPGARIISIGDIQHSGATNAWEVLERTGVYMPSAASPLVPEAQSRREHASAPRVVVDGVPMLELRLLRDIPVNVISSMRIVSNVIVIRTHP